MLKNALGSEHWEWCFQFFWPRPFRAEATSFAVILTSTAWVLCTALGLRIFVPLVVLTKHLGFGPSIWMTQLVMG
jgi:hypothetical protein